MYYSTADINFGGSSVQTGNGMLVSGTTSNTTEVSINAISDQISQEGKETFEIPLSVTSDDELTVPVFVEGPAMITVNDTSGEIVTHLCWIAFIQVNK